MTDMATTTFQDAIRDRLQTGFRNWNGGYEAWLDWCNTLYEPDAHYNVYGRRLSMQEYKDLMGTFFEKYDVKMGDFHNMLIEDDWCGIRYQTHIIEKATGKSFDQESFEFVHFKDNPAPIGARVIEGWATSTNPLSE